MLTAVDGIRSALTGQMAGVGSNTFNISSEDELAGMRHGRQSAQRINPRITYNEAKEFKNRFGNDAHVSVSFPAAGNARIRYETNETPPKISVIGADEWMLSTSGLAIDEGRNMTAGEAESGRRVAIIGSKLKSDLFGNTNAIGRSIKIDDATYTVLGTLETKGQMFGGSQDNLLIIPINAAKSQYANAEIDYSIAVVVPSVEQMDEAINKATGIFRSIRRLSIQEQNNFSMTRADSLIGILVDNIRYLQIIAFAIGIITLLGAAIGLTNIMLVTVTERTREIGIRKALGANYSAIRNQFLWESIVICQVGGLAGIGLGLILGNIIARYFSDAFVIPWAWIIVGFILCLFTGIFAGLYPARKAARLDPVEALRHE